MGFSMSEALKNWRIAEGSPSRVFLSRTVPLTLTLWAKTTLIERTEMIKAESIFFMVC